MPPTVSLPVWSTNDALTLIAITAALFLALAINTYADAVKAAARKRQGRK